ncbi:MAG: 2-alkenal reductase [Chthoniobacteraceae bacterium]|nr:2-alkenal reductase [Chthoniobacteraceae bacterium]
MRRFFFILLLAALVAFGYHRWTVLNGPVAGRRAVEQFTPAEHPRIDLKDVQVLAAIDAEYSRLISTVTPAVVAIRSRGVAPSDPFEMLFRRQLGAAAPVKKSLGSGVIVSKEGHVLTNAHVIEGMSEIMVQLTDGRSVPARLIGEDKQTDIAVLRIDAPRIEALPMGNSDELRVGQMVFAIGNPFGLQETVTQGIISAKGRSISDSGVEFIQTDAAVNQGNSGGPLLNLRGEIIGINSAILSESGGWLGISFAIPSNTARRALESIIKVGRIVRPYLGVLMADVTEDLAQEFKAPDTQGAFIHDVVPTSPAAKAGLKPGDIIRRLNGTVIRNSAALREQVAASAVGAKLSLDYLREGVEKNVEVEVVEAPTASAAIQRPAAPQSLRPGTRMPRRQLVTNVLDGIQVSEIPARLRDQLPENARGVFVTGLEENAAAARTLRDGDVIEEINQQPVSSVDDFEKLVNALPAGQRALLHVARGDSRLFVVVSPAK